MAAKHPQDHWEESPHYPDMYGVAIIHGTLAGPDLSDLFDWLTEMNISHDGSQYSLEEPFVFHATFYFNDRDIATLFKLTWGGK